MKVMSARADITSIAGIGEMLAKSPKNKGGRPKTDYHGESVSIRNGAAGLTLRLSCLGTVFPQALANRSYREAALMKNFYGERRTHLQLQ